MGCADNYDEACLRRVGSGLCSENNARTVLVACCVAACDSLAVMVA